MTTARKVCFWISTLDADIVAVGAGFFVIAYLCGFLAGLLLARGL